MKKRFQKVTLNLVEGDKETLQKFYASMGWTVAARILIHKYCKALREQEGKAKVFSDDLDNVEL